MSVGSTQAVFFTIDKRYVPSMSLTMSELYQTYVDEDGFLYICYSSQEMFGGNFVPWAEWPLGISCLLFPFNQRWSRSLRADARMFYYYAMRWEIYQFVLVWVRIFQRVQVKLRCELWRQFATRRPVYISLEVVTSTWSNVSRWRRETVAGK